MLKVWSFVKFSVDYLPRPVEPAVKLFLWQSAASTYAILILSLSLHILNLLFFWVITFLVFPLLVMALIWVFLIAIWFLSFGFVAILGHLISHFLSLSSEVSICFLSSHYCFLDVIISVLYFFLDLCVLLLLSAVIKLFLLFFIYYSNPCFAVSTHFSILTNLFVLFWVPVLFNSKCFLSILLRSPLCYLFYLMFLLHSSVSSNLIVFFKNYFWFCLLFLFVQYCVRQWPVRPGFNPWSSHIKDSKNGTWCLLS